MSERRPYVHPLSHGLLSQQVLLPGEDGEALRELGERLRAELQPVGELEELLVDRVTAAYWRGEHLSGYYPTVLYRIVETNLGEDLY